MTRQDKIQHLLITHLMAEGSITLVLPDGLVVEMGIVKEGENGKLQKIDNYAWMIASQNDREVSIDSYNLGLRFKDNLGKIILEDSTESSNGKKMRCFNVI